MRIQFTLTLADYQAAQYLRWHQSSTRRFVHFFVYEGIPILAAVTGCVVVKKLGLPGLGMPYCFETLFGLTVAVVYLKLTAKGRQAKRYKKQFERRFSSEERTAWIEMNDSAVSSAIAGTDAESFEWNKIIEFAQDDKMTLLYLTEKRFLLFPTPALDSADRADLDDLIASQFAARMSC